MPKMKTHKGVKKRMKVTAKGKVHFRHPNAGHLMSGKTGDRRRVLRRPAILEGAIAKQIRIALGKA